MSNVNNYNHELKSAYFMANTIKSTKWNITFNFNIIHITTLILSAIQARVLQSGSSENNSTTC
jgi:hypothetical protein